MKRNLLLYLSILILNSNFAFAQHIEATLDFCNFRANDTLGLFEYYLSFPSNSVKHKVVNQDSLVSTINVVVLMKKMNDTVYYDNYNLSSSPNSEQSVKYEEYIVQNQIILPNGEYEFIMEAKDVLSEKNSNLSVDFPVKMGFNNSILQISDIQNLQSYRNVDFIASNVKNGIEMVSRNSNFFSQENDKFIFYSEIYNADEVFGADMVFLIEARISDTKTGKVYHNTGIFKKMKAAAVNPILAEVDLSKLPTGNYNLNIEIKDKTNKSLFTKQKYFQRYHPLLEDPNLVVEKEESFEDQTFDDCLIKESIDMRNLTFLLNGLMPLAKQNERSFAEAVANSGDEEQKINYLCYFFQKRETNEKDAQTLFLEYKDRLEIAEKQYATQTMAGYQTDRGRVFIQYGKPNRVDNEFSDMTRTAINNAVIPYEIWTYYNVIEPQPQSNVQFVFAQKNRANYNYEIVHSTAIGEFQNPSWREEINSRMMYQEDPNQGYR